jgi:hypothetical protein
MPGRDLFFALRPQHNRTQRRSLSRGTRGARMQAQSQRIPTCRHERRNILKVQESLLNYAFLAVYPPRVRRLPQHALAETRLPSLRLLQPVPKRLRACPHVPVRRGRLVVCRSFLYWSCAKRRRPHNQERVPHKHDSNRSSKIEPHFNLNGADNQTAA